MKYRYGKEDDDLYSGLILLSKSVYSSERNGGTESVFAARPNKEIKSVSTWGSIKIGYDWKLLENALGAYLKAASRFSQSETFQYDITDIAGQVLSNQGQRGYDSAMLYFNQKEKSKYNYFKNEFFHLLDLQEQLMSTNKNRMVGTWLNQAGILAGQIMKRTWLKEMPGCRSPSGARIPIRKPTYMTMHTKNGQD